MYVGTLITKIRQRTGKLRYAVDSLGVPTEGIPQSLVLDFLNEGKEYIQTSIISSGSTICDVSGDVSTVAGQYAYQINDNVHLGNRIRNAQFSFSGQERNLRDFPLLRDEQMHYLPLANPTGYIRRGSRIITVGIPTTTGALMRFWFPRTWDNFGLIAGQLSGAHSGATTALALDNDSYLNAVDLGLLDATSMICIVSSDGTMVQRNIEVTSYSSSTFTITIPSQTVTSSTGDFIVIGKDTTIDTDAVAPNAAPMAPAVLQYIKTEAQMRMFDVSTSVDAIRENAFLRRIMDAVLEGYEDELDESDIPISDPFAMS